MFKVSLTNTKAIILQLTVNNIKTISAVLTAVLGFENLEPEMAADVRTFYNPSLTKNLLLHLIEDPSKQEPLSGEHLIVFYLNDEKRFLELNDQLKLCGVNRIPSFNPYWDSCGATFLLPEGLRIVLCHGAYRDYKARIAMPADALAEAQSYFEAAVGFKKFAEFKDHEGFDGVMLDVGELDCHLELTHYHPVVPCGPLSMPLSPLRFSMGLVTTDSIASSSPSYHDGQGHYLALWEAEKISWLPEYLKRLATPPPPRAFQAVTSKGGASCDSHESTK